MQQNLDIDISKIKNAVRCNLPSKTGAQVDCIVIPLEGSGMFIKDNGGVILDVVAFDKREVGKYGETHILKQSFPKAMRESMSEEERQAIPILGNLKPSKQGAAVTPTPNGLPFVAPAVVGANDELPF